MEVIQFHNRRFPIEVLPDDAIIDAPSLVTPLLLKRAAAKPPSSIGLNPPKTNRKPVDNYVRLATIASLTHARSSGYQQILTLNDYYSSSVGEMLLTIGLSRVREYNLQSQAKKLSHKISKNDEDRSELEEELASTMKELSETQLSNSAYKSDTIIKCPHCPFKTEFGVVIDGHTEVPHMNSRKVFACNWCTFKSKDSNLLIYHNLVEHKKRCRLDREPSLHNCQFCEFECKSKRKILPHLNKCQMLFPHQTFLGPKGYSENGLPAITSKLITQEDVKAYEQALKSLRLAAYNPHQLKVSTGSQHQNGAQQPLLVVPRPSGQNNSTHILHLISAQQDLSKNKSSILQHPKQTQSSFMNGKSVLRTAADIIMAPHNMNAQSTGSDNTGTLNASSSPSPKSSTFVICEICDSYIKDLSQLKLHMDALHKVSLLVHFPGIFFRINSINFLII